LTMPVAGHPYPWALRSVYNASTMKPLSAIQRKGPLSARPGLLPLAPVGSIEWLARDWGRDDLRIAHLERYKQVFQSLHPGEGYELDRLTLQANIDLLTEAHCKRKTLGLKKRDKDSIDSETSAVEAMLMRSMFWGVSVLPGSMLKYLVERIPSLLEALCSETLPSWFATLPQDPSIAADIKAVLKFILNLPMTSNAYLFSTEDQTLITVRRGFHPAASTMEGLAALLAEDRRSNTPTTRDVCFWCRTSPIHAGVTLSYCAACGVVPYCGKDCQKLDWDAWHRHECKGLKSCGKNTQDLLSKRESLMMKADRHLTIHRTTKLTVQVKRPANISNAVMKLTGSGVYSDDAVRIYCGIDKKDRPVFYPTGWNFVPLDHLGSTYRLLTHAR